MDKEFLLIAFNFNIINDNYYRYQKNSSKSNFIMSFYEIYQYNYINRIYINTY